jgi:hypothetical protein
VQHHAASTPTTAHQEEHLHLIRKTFIVLAVLSLAPVQPLVFEPETRELPLDARMLASHEGITATEDAVNAQIVCSTSIALVQDF